MVFMDKDNLEMNCWRDNVVASALVFANHVWEPTDKNFLHGYDRDGIFVNTPDCNYISSKFKCGWWILDQYNKGIPYNWGGSSTIDEFNVGIATGKFAGNVPDSRDNGVSKYCVGVDCSGLVTICWGLSEKISTKSINKIASPLDSMDLLLPGDLILLPGSHVMIFINFVDYEKTSAQIVDSSRNTGRVLLRTVTLSDLLNSGYSGFRKNTEGR